MEKTKEARDYLSCQRKLVILEWVKKFKSVNKILKQFKIAKSTYYAWKNAFDKYGEAGLVRNPLVAHHPANKIQQSVIDKVFSLRKEYQLGSWRIKWYLERYNDINISESSVFRILKRNGVDKLHKKIILQ